MSLMLLGEGNVWLSTLEFHPLTTLDRDECQVYGYSTDCTQPHPATSDELARNVNGFGLSCPSLGQMIQGSLSMNGGLVVKHE